MKLKILFLICFSLAVCTQIEAKTESAKKFLVVSGQEQDAIDALPILDGVVIKFKNDSVILKKKEWETKVDKAELKYFDHVEDFRSDLTVRLLSNVDLNFPLDNKLVTLHNEYDGNVPDIQHKTNADGVASFTELPAGFYTLQITDPVDIFKPVTLQGYHLGISSIEEIMLTTSSVEMIPWDGSNQNSIYIDLHGRIIPNPGNGIFICNGKKVIVK